MEIILGAIFICLFLLIIQAIQNRTLRKRISLVESTFIAKIEALTEAHDTLKAQTVLLTKDQEEWLKKNKEDIQKKLKKLSEDLKEENQKLNSDQEKWVQGNREEFDKKLKEELNKACEKIKFDEIEYKKTITKKRKEFNRKNGAHAKPQREWRSIDDDTSPSMQ